METTIFKTIKAAQIELMFNTCFDNFTIKHYKTNDVPTELSILENEKYKFEIKIRHNENTNANDLFDRNFCKLFPTKLKKLPKKRLFLCSTEIGRVKGRISFYIAEIIPNEGLRLIDNDYTCLTSSHKGLESEAVQALVNKNELPITAINKDHYRDGRVKNYSLIMVEGRGLNYINQIN